MIILVKAKEQHYPISISDGFQDFIKVLDSFENASRWIVITDQTVAELYLQPIIEVLMRTNKKIFTHRICPGEKSKCIQTTLSIYDFLMETCVDRNDVMIALGGGVVGDVVGFSASTYLRGIRLIHVPTTLLAQIDSSIGGKVGINHHGIKNLIGSFYQPNLIYTNIHTLKTLTDKQINCGLAEAVVHGIIMDPSIIWFIQENLDQIRSRNELVMLELIKKNCYVKVQIIQQDEKDTGIRKILNFGHTFGHVIESHNRYQLSHGECVSIGIVKIFEVAVSLGMAEEGTLETIKKLLNAIGLPTSISESDMKHAIQYLEYDKKCCDQMISVVLPLEIGKVKVLDIAMDKLKKIVLQQ